MTVIRPNSISGVSSITGSGGDISIFRADGTAADVTVNNITSGVVTATTFSGNVTGNVTGNITGTTASFTGDVGVGGKLTYEDVTNIDSVGVITARDGLRVTGIATITGDVKVGGSVEITDGTTSVNKHSVGIGTTTTAGRNAGVSTSTGTIIYNSTLGKVQVYVENEWKNVKLQVAPLLLNYLVIGGGGAGGGNFRGGGGGAGAYRTNWNNENQGGGQSSGASVSLNTGTAYSVVVGAGGAGVDDANGNAGGQSKFDDITADGGTVTHSSFSTGKRRKTMFRCKWTSNSKRCR